MNKAQYFQQHLKKKQHGSIRRLSHKPQPIPCGITTETTAFATQSSNLEKQETRQIIFCQDDKLFDQKNQQNSPRTNKIYNQVVHARQLQNLGGSNRLLQVKPSLNNISSAHHKHIAAVNMERPKSSHPNKPLMNSELFISNTELPKCQNRPGSSKSSRLFKRKGIMVHETINSQNQEFECPIRVTSIGSSRNKCIGTSISLRNRAGTSLNQTQRTVDRVPPKIDQQFFRLFAK